MTTLESLLADRGLTSFGFADSPSDAAFKTLVVLLPYDVRLPDEPDPCQAACSPPLSLLRIGAFAAANHYAALVRLLKDIARTLGCAYSLPKSAFRVCVNSNLPEKTLALSAGLGFMGRSSLFVSHAYGPACIIGLLMMPAECAGAEVTAGPAAIPDSCGSCSACLSACPTGAIGAAGFKRERCLQHWMSREDFPDTMLAARGNRLYGCDECVRACPRSAGAWSQDRDLLLPAEMRPGAFVNARDLAGKDAAAVRGLFAGTALGMGWMPHAAWAAFAERFVQGQVSN